jgi:endonuclease/exonuclease/phosphatase family metal-dependent hydrolase
MRTLRALLLLAVTATLLGGAASLDRGPGRQTYLQLNMCGNVCNHGGLAVVRNLEETIATRRPVAVTLNEVCENQYDRLAADLDAYRGRFDATGPICGNGARYGNAVLARASDVDLIGSWPLPDLSGGETRRLMCVRSDGLAVCVTHISYLQADIAAQIDAVAAILDGLDRAGAVVLGGDLNTDPADPRLGPLYGICHGATGVTFHQHSIDYIFLSEHWSSAQAHAVDAAGGFSDHEGLFATATLLNGA